MSTSPTPFVDIASLTPSERLGQAQDIAQDLTYEALLALPLNPDERMLQSRVFDTRQRLVQKLLCQCAEAYTEQNKELKISADAMEDAWREALPPLLLPPIGKIAHFSAWRTALLALLGFLLGLAVGQAFTSLGVLGAYDMGDAARQGQAMGESLGQPSFSMGIQLICGLLGAMGIVWFSEYLLGGMTSGRLVFLGKKYTWKRFRRFFTWGVGGLLVLSLVRDFMGAKLGILHLVQGFGFIFTSGQVLPFFANVYGIVCFCVAFALLLQRPLSFDEHDFSEKLQVAIAQWWTGASLVGPLLIENMQLKHDPTKDAWKKVGLELYSLAGELPEARGQWLKERLRRVGVEATREQGDAGALYWSEEMSERYTPLGFIAVGDACYVDEPPLLEQGLLVRKGTVRKVRK